MVDARTLLDIAAEYVLADQTEQIAEQVGHTVRVDREALVERFDQALREYVAQS